MGLDSRTSVDVMESMIVSSLARSGWPPAGLPPSRGSATGLPDVGTIPAGGMTPNGGSTYLDAGDAAAYLRITMKSLYGIVERGHLEPLRGPRNRYRFTAAMLDDYLARGRER